MTPVITRRYPTSIQFFLEAAQIKKCGGHSFSKLMSGTFWSNYILVQLGVITTTVMIMQPTVVQDAAQIKK
jgi:hypothetical protein